MEYPFSFRWTKQHEAFCIAERIYLNHAQKVTGVYRARNWLLLEKGQKIKINCEVTTENNSSMPNRSFCTIGAHSYANSKLPADMQIGRYCSLASGITIMGSQHPIDRFTTSPVTYIKVFAEKSLDGYAGNYEITPFEGIFAPSPKVGHDVWIGGDVVLKGGITIGHGAIIASNAVVTKDVPPYAIVAGVPARIIRYRFPSEIVDRLLALSWWDYKYTDLPTAEVDGVEDFIVTLEKKISTQEITKHEFKKINLSKEFYRLANQ